MTGLGCYSALSGQEKAKGLFARALRAGRLPHAYLFRGPDGVGKRLFAVGVAMAINCRAREGERACGRCSSCRKYMSGNHPDLVCISPLKGTIRIEQIRLLGGELGYPPLEAAMRVIIVEDTHTMRREAANSLLKTLEEPPADNLLILTADASRELLPTLMSRCQVLPFAPLQRRQAALVLQGHGIPAEEALQLAELAEGSPGRALALKDSGMVPLWREVVDLLDEPRPAADGEVGAVLRAAEKMAALKENLPAFFGLLRQWLRSRLVEACGAAPPGEERAARKCWSSAELFATLQAISRAEEELARNCSRNLVCEVLLFRLQGARDGYPSGAGRA